MMTASSSMDELSCSSISYSTDAAAATTTNTIITTTNGNNENDNVNYSDCDFRSFLKEDEPYNTVASTAATSSSAAAADVATATTAVDIEDDGRETNIINMATDVMTFDLVPPPPPHIELLHLSTDATVKAAYLISSSSSSSSEGSCGVARSNTKKDDNADNSTTVTCIAHVMSYLDDDGRKSARASCSYLRGAVDQYKRVYIPLLPCAMTSSTIAELADVGEEEKEEEADEDEEEEQTLTYLQDHLREQTQQLQTKKNHALSSFECRTDAREKIPYSSDEGSVKPSMNGNDNRIQLRSQLLQHHQPSRQLAHPRVLTPTPPAKYHHHQLPPHDNFRYPGESLSSSLRTESLDDSTLLSSNPHQSILEEDDEESWELNPTVHHNGHQEWADDDDVDNDKCNSMNAKIRIESKTKAMSPTNKEEKEDEKGMLDVDSTAPDILAQFSDAMLYGDTPPVLSQFMSGIVDSAKLAVSQLYHHQQQHHHGGGGFNWRNRIDDNDGVDDAGPIKIGDKYYSHNEALQRWRRAKVKLEDRYHGIDTEGNVKMERTTYFEKSSLFQDKDAKGEKITLRNYWDGGGGGEKEEENEEKNVTTQDKIDGEDEVVMSIDHLVKTYAMLKKEAKINPVVNEEAKDEANDKEVEEKYEKLEKKCNFHATTGESQLVLKKGDLVDGDTAALSSSSSNSSWDSLPTMAPPPPPPELHATSSTSRTQNVGSTSILQGDEETNCFAEEESVPTDISSKMSSQGVAYNFIGGNAVRKDCEQSVLGSQYGMEVLLKIPKKTVVARKPRTMASHNFGVAKVVARHDPVMKQSDIIRTEIGCGGGAVVASNTKTTAKQEVTPLSPMRSQLKKNNSHSWTNRANNGQKILPLKLKLGLKKSVKS